jgi:polyhydroxybutyrate depolymerase
MNRHLILFLNVLIIPYFSLLFSQEKVIYVNDKNNPGFMFARSYYLHLPANYSDTADYPLVLGLHGRGGAGHSWSATPLWTEKSDLEYFIAAFPSAKGDWWNISSEHDTYLSDDVEFISVLIDTLCNHYSIDSTKIYAIGMSNGGFMVYRLADELSHKIAAIAPVAGKMAYSDINPEFPVSIVHFHGLYDNTVPYEEVNYPSVFSTLSTWAAKNNCNPKPDTIDVSFGIKKISWQAPINNGDIDLYTIANSAHAWPSGYISATDIIWDFFESHSRDYSTNIQKNDGPIISIAFNLLQNYPNPFNSSTNIHYQLSKSAIVKSRIFNLQGQLVRTLVEESQKAGEHSVSWDGRSDKGLQVTSGVYVYSIEANQNIQTKKMLFLR